MSMTSYFKDKYYLMKEVPGLGGSDVIENLPFYEYVQIRKLLYDDLKKQEEQQRAAKDEQTQQTRSSFKVPNFKMPKLFKR